MAARGRCAVCRRRTRKWLLEKTGGLCWGCAHPGFWFMTLLIAATIGVILLAVIMRCLKPR